MTLLGPDITSEENIDAVADVPSHIGVSSVSFIFCVFFSLSGLFSFKGYISLIEVFFTLFFPAIIGIIAIVYTFRTVIAKKNLDYENALRYSQLAKIWTVMAFFSGAFFGFLSCFSYV